jgi:hypothetical protein
MRFKFYARSIFDPLTEPLTQLLKTYPIAIAKLNFFSQLCGILFAMILTDTGYFAGLAGAIVLFFIVIFLRSLTRFQDSMEDAKAIRLQRLSTRLCEAILFVGLALHNSEMNLILPLGILSVFGFLLIPLFETEMNWTFYMPSFDTRMLIILCSLLLHLSSALLLFYALFFNLQLIFRWIRYAH